MKIAIDALGIHYFGGGRTATLRLLEALFDLDTQNQYLVALTQFEPSLQRPNVRQWVAPVKGRLLVRLWAQILFPIRLRSYDLVHFIKNLGTFGVPTRQVVTIYDLTILRLPQIYPKVDVWYWKTLQRLTMRQADAVIAISESTAEDIEAIYGVGPEKTHIIFPAQSPHFRPALPEEIEQVRARYGLPEQYVVHVGRLDQKKNIPLILEGFARFREKSGYPGKLVFVGEEYRKCRDASIPAVVERLGLAEHTLFTGPMPDEDVPAVYSAALAFVFCSRHEGFGIVTLEAMACGTPVIITPLKAVLEAAGDAALVLEGEEADFLAQALEKIWHDPALRAALREKGLRRAAQFSWAEAARQTLALYEEVARGSAG